MARSSYEDWTGNAVAEKSMGHSERLYQLCGLDIDSWWIVAIDAYASGRTDTPKWTVRVYAFDRAGRGSEEYGDMQQIAVERGSLPVTEILVHGVSLDDIVGLMKMTHVHLRDRHAPDKIDVTERVGHPEQGGA